MCGKIALRAQHRIDEADAFEQLSPIDGGHQAHARDDVANRDIRCALPLMLLMDQVVGRGSLGRKAFVQPKERRHHLRVLFTQPLHELNREGRWQLSLEASKARLPARPPGCRSQQPVGKGVGLFPHCLAIHDVFGQRRKFSTRTTRSVIATAQSSPMVNGCTRW